MAQDLTITDEQVVAAPTNGTSPVEQTLQDDADSINALFSPADGDSSTAFSEETVESDASTDGEPQVDTDVPTPEPTQRELELQRELAVSQQQQTESQARITQHEQEAQRQRETQQFAQQQAQVEQEMAIHRQRAFNAGMDEAAIAPFLEPLHKALTEKLQIGQQANDYRQFVQAQAEAAAKLSAETGVPVAHLLQYTKLDDMTRAAHSEARVGVLEKEIAGFKKEQTETKRVTQKYDQNSGGSQSGGAAEIWNKYGRGDLEWSPTVAKAGKSLGYL